MGDTKKADKGNPVERLNGKGLNGKPHKEEEAVGTAEGKLEAAGVGEMNGKMDGKAESLESKTGSSLLDAQVRHKCSERRYTTRNKVFLVSTAKALLLTFCKIFSSFHYPSKVANMQKDLFFFFIKLDSYH